MALLSVSLKVNQKDAIIRPILHTLALSEDSWFGSDRKIYFRQIIKWDTNLMPHPFHLRIILPCKTGSYDLVRFRTGGCNCLNSIDCELWLFFLLLILSCIIILYYGRLGLLLLRLPLTHQEVLDRIGASENMTSATVHPFSLI